MLLILFALALLLGVLYNKRCKQMSILRRLDIPGPRPNLIFGNAIDILMEGSLRAFPKWTKKYGKVVGIYIGGWPQVLISDLEFVRQVMIKDFHLFSDRNQIIPGGIFPTPLFQNSLPFAHRNPWKQLRSLISPWFSRSKLNVLEPLIMSNIDKLTNQLNEKAECGREFNVAPMFTDCIFSIGSNFVLGLDFSLNRMSREVQSVYKIGQPQLEKSMLATLMILFPSLTFILYPLRLWWEKIRIKMEWSPEGICVAFLKKCVQEARKIANKESLLQSLLTAKDSRSTSPQVEDDDSKRLSLSEDNIISNSVLLLAASTDTTAVTLSFVIHNLTNNEDIQEKLRSDLQYAVEKSGGKLDYETVSSIPLLINVIKETLRMFPPGAIGASRVAETNYEYKGYRIPKGTGVFIEIHSIHNDPEYWQEPEKFQPNRFEKSIDKLTYVPFGIGPRSCIGMQYVYTALQLQLASLVLKFRFQPGPSTEKNIETYETYGILRPKNGVFCALSKV